MQINSIKTFILRVLHLYVDGFKDLSNWGRKVWIIILIKLFVIFVIIRLLLMPDVLKKDFKTDEQRSKHILEILTNPNR